MGSFSFGGILAYPTRALLQWRNETNLAVKLSNDEGSLFASLFWMIGLFFAPIGGILSGRVKLIVGFIERFYLRLCLSLERSKV